ncbi:MAG: N-acetylmuramoyl-L-alanine amidase [Syntrophaceae bacterium]|nr:N-acetylmuramoyl-L-alanine amidase [Syntrophaceae bacterium]
MRRSLLLIAVWGILGLGWIGEAMAAPRLLNVRKSSTPESTRVVLDLEAPPVYEIQSSPAAPILTIHLQRLSLPRGAQEVLIEDRVVRKVRIDPSDKEGVKVILFLHQPSNSKVFALTRDKDKPDRLVIDVFRPRGDIRDKTEKPESPPAKPESREAKSLPAKEEMPLTKPPSPEPERVKSPPAKEGAPIPKPPRPEPEQVKPPPAQIEKKESKLSDPELREKKGISPKIEDPPRASPLDKSRDLAVPPPKGIARLVDIRHWPAPDHTRIVADLEGAPEHEILPQTDPLVWTLRLRGIVLPRGRQEISVGDQVINKIQVDPEGRDTANLSVFLIKPSRLNVFVLKPFEDKPDRLVIDVSRPDLEEKEKEQRQGTRELKAKKKRIVVIDPGHGGDDPGAVGPRKTFEKDIVLDLAHNLQKTLDATGEIRAFLTRRGDYFVPLMDRIKIAQEYEADLFISLHCNGSRSRQTRGSSVYCLSLKGASDMATQLLAQKENASDMVGGTSRAPTQKDLDSILLDLEQTHAINESLHLGGLVLNELGKVNRIQFSQPRQAGFAVLKAPEFPSILIETAFLTNPGEEMLLRKKSFQDQVSQAIAAAVKRYIPLLSAKEGSSGGNLHGRGTKRGGG